MWQAMLPCIGDGGPLQYGGAGRCSTFKALTSGAATYTVPVDEFFMVGMVLHHDASDASMFLLELDL